MQRKEIASCLGMNTDLDDDKLKDGYMRNITNFKVQGGDLVKLGGYAPAFNELPPGVVGYKIERFEEMTTGEVSWWLFSNDGIYKYEYDIPNDEWNWIEKFEDILPFGEDCSVIQYQNKIFVADRNNPPFYILPRGAKYFSFGGAGVVATYQIDITTFIDEGMGELIISTLDGSSVVLRNKFGLPTRNVGENYYLKQYYANDDGDIMWLIGVGIDGINEINIRRWTLYLYRVSADNILSYNWNEQLSPRAYADPINENEFMLNGENGPNEPFTYINSTFAGDSYIILFNGNIVYVKLVCDYNIATHILLCKYNLFSFKYDQTSSTISFQKISPTDIVEELQVAETEYGGGIYRSPLDPIRNFFFNYMLLDTNFIPMLWIVKNNLVIDINLTHRVPFTAIPTSKKYQVLYTPANILYDSENIGTPYTKLFPITNHQTYPFSDTDLQMIEYDEAQYRPINDNMFFGGLLNSQGVFRFVYKEVGVHTNFVKYKNGSHVSYYNLRIEDYTPRNIFYDFNIYKNNEIYYNKSYAHSVHCGKSSYFGYTIHYSIMFGIADILDIHKFILIEEDDRIIRSRMSNIYVDKNNVYVIKLTFEYRVSVTNFEFDPPDGSHAIGVLCIYDLGEWDPYSMDFNDYIYLKAIVLKNGVEIFNGEICDLTAMIGTTMNAWYNDHNWIILDDFPYAFITWNPSIGPMIDQAIRDFYARLCPGGDIAIFSDMNTNYNRGVNFNAELMSPSDFSDIEMCRYNQSTFDNDMLWYINSPVLFDLQLVNEYTNMVYQLLEVKISYLTTFGETLLTSDYRVHNVDHTKIKINFGGIINDYPYELVGLNVYFFNNGNLIGSDFIDLSTEQLINDFIAYPFMEYTQIPSNLVQYAGKSFMNNPYIMIKHLDRLILGGDFKFPDYSYFSKTLFPEVFPIANSRPIEYNDNDNVTGYCSLYDRLYVFKNNYLYVIVGDIEEGIILCLSKKLGAIAKDSIVVINNQIFFLSNYGIGLCTGNDARLLSEGAINNWLLNEGRFTRQDLSLAKGVHSGKYNEYKLYVGKYVIVYNIGEQAFYIEEKIADNVYRMVKQINQEDVQDYIIFNHDSGRIHKEDNGLTFYDRKRFCTLITKRFKLSDFGQMTKILYVMFRHGIGSIFNIIMNNKHTQANSIGKEDIKVRFVGARSSSLDITIHEEGDREFLIKRIGIDYE